MASLEPLKKELIDLYKRLETKRVVYFHCDHWEPWRQVKRGMTVYCRENQDAIGRFADQIDKIDFARRLTLFYKPSFNFLVGSEIFANDPRPFWAGTPDDGVHFMERTPQEKKIAFDAISYLKAKTGCELQFHLHHENFTFNTDQHSPARKAFLTSSAGREAEELRFDTAVKLSLSQIAEDSGRALDRWFFVHGHWALNASDPAVCHLTREIEILYANGGRGDFTVPSGRPAVNPRLEVPYFATPLDAPKCYDLQEAEPEYAYGNRMAPDRGKFLIWSSVIKHKGSSLDYYAPWVRQRLEDVALPARELINESFRAGGTIYMKTHAHSLHPDYADSTRFPICPHAYPGIQTLFCIMFDAAAAAGCEVAFLTASEVYDEFAAAKYEPAGGFGLTIPGDARVIEGIQPAPRKWRPESTGIYFNSEAAAKYVPPAALSGTASPPAPETAAAIAPMAAPAMPEEPPPAARTAAPLLGSPPHADVIDAAAVDIARKRIADFGEAGSGAGSYYASKAAAGHILGTYEVELAQGIIAMAQGYDRVIDIGCGYGVLTILLAANGLKVEGLEPDSKRIAVAQDVLKACGDGRVPVPMDCTLRFGRFPQALAGEDVSRSLALFTNMTTTITPLDRQELIGALSAFKTVILDVQRFLERRTSRGDCDALVAELEAAGLTRPRVFADCEDRGRYMAFDGAPAAKQRRKNVKAA